MPPVVSFIGWHNSGKTTLTRQVVTCLKSKGVQVAVVKSTKETGIIVDQPGTDTALYKEADADALALCAPDQLIIQRKPIDLELAQFGPILFPEVDIIIAEGFKHATNVPKIEVRRDQNAPWLHQQVSGVFAVASDGPAALELLHFTLNDAEAIATYIEETFLRTVGTSSSVHQGNKTS